MGQADWLHRPSGAFKPLKKNKKIRNKSNNIRGKVAGAKISEVGGNNDGETHHSIQA